VISAAQIEDVAHLAPNHRATLSANWTHGPLALNARENYYGSWVDAIDYCQTQAPGSSNCATPLTWQHFGAKFTTDVDVSYTFARMFTLTIGANNLFNTYPDRIANSGINPIYVLTGSTADGQIYPRPGGPFGINGGFYYAKLRVKLGEGARVRAAPPPVVLPPPPPATQTCPDGSVIAVGAACPPPPPPPPAPPPPPPAPAPERG
jgi:iron complex outermembrane receptor protein